MAIQVHLVDFDFFFSIRAHSDLESEIKTHKKLRTNCVDHTSVVAIEVRAVASNAATVTKRNIFLFGLRSGGG